MSETPAPIGAFVNYMTSRAMAVDTIRRRESSLGQFARYLTPMSILEATPVDIEEWLGTKRAARTRHAYRSDLSAFYRWAVRRKLVTTSPIDDTDPIRVPRGLPRPVPLDAVVTIIAAATMPLRLGLAIAFYCGLRRAEISRLVADDIQIAPVPLIAVRGGKGSKDRIVPMPPQLASMMPGRIATGRVVPMTPDRLGRRAAEHMRGLGYDCTLHQARHAYGTEAARLLNGDLVAVGRLMGHDSPSTTRLYCGWQGGGVEALGGMYPDAA